MPSRRRKPVRRGGRGRPQGRRRAAYPQTPRTLRGLSGRFNYQRTYAAITVALTGGANTYGALSLSGSSMPSSMQSMLLTFDVCTVNWVDVLFIPQWNVNAVSSGDEGVPQIAVVRNYDDFTAPATFDNVLSQRGSRLTQFMRPFRMRTFPRGLNYAFTGTSPGFYGVNPSQQWLNTTYFGSSVNGQLPMLKFVIGSPTAPPANYPGSGVFTIFFRVSITCAQNVG